MKLLFAASEVAPFAKTGGLADVVGSLPRAVANLGHDCAVFMPLYRSTRNAGVPMEATPHRFEIPIGNLKVPGRLWRSRLPRSDVPVYLVEQPHYFERDDPTAGKGLYQERLPSGRLRDYADNCQRFIFFSRAILESFPFLDWFPDVIHANDWQTGLIPAYLREMYSLKTIPLAKSYGQIRTLFTVHNLAYQGVFWHWDMQLTGLDWKHFNYRQMEFFGHLNLLKTGLVFADAVNTVSPQYAKEIQTKEHGCGLEGVLRHHADKLSGIVNGVDYADWNPATDPHIVKHYDAPTVADGKPACKAALQQRLLLPIRPDVPMLAMISRLAEQKGLKLIQETADELLREDIQLVFLGVGEPMYHRFLELLQKDYPQKVAAVFEFNETLAHQIEAGADIFLMPSRFEPSGLNQLYSLKYGTVPIVRDTGGLHDTVADGVTGFRFKEYAALAFLAAVRRALMVYRQSSSDWLKMMRTGMNQDWSWESSARKYETVYRKISSTADIA